MTDPKFNAILDLTLFLGAILFLAIQYRRSPAWRETIRELFWWRKG